MSQQLCFSTYRDGLRALRKMKTPLVTVYGSHRFTPQSTSYRDAYALAEALGKRGYGIVTGGGPGVMSAANAGAMAAGTSSIGVRVPALSDLETSDDGILTHIITVRDLALRRIIMAQYSQALVFYPGAFGTMDEIFEVLALFSADLASAVPVICIKHDYWDGLFDWMRTATAHYNTVADWDYYIRHVTICDNHHDALRIITN